MNSSLVALNRKARDIGREGRNWIEPTARLGLLSKGITYIIVGALGLAAAFQDLPAAGPREALRIFIQHPSGIILLPLIGAGLWAYALWRFVQAFFDPEHRGTKWKPLLLRIGFLGNGLLHFSIGWTAFGLVVGNERGSQEFEKDWTAWLLAQPWGEYFLGTLAISVACAGIYQFTRAWKVKFLKRWKGSSEAREAKNWARHIGQIGLCARGIVFTLLGWLLLRAAVHLNSNEAGGVGDALQLLSTFKFGAWLVAFVSIGLLAYGLFALLEAHHRQIFGGNTQRK